MGEACKFAIIMVLGTRPPAELFQDAGYQIITTFQACNPKGAEDVLTMVRKRDLEG
jgi:hypothetical protein